MPHMKLLHDRCPVGSGASDPLRKILEDEGILLPKEIKTVKRKDYTGKYEVEAMKGSKFEIVAVHKSGKQLLQVTQGMAGTLDRAHAVAVKLAEYANKGKDKEWCSKKKMELIDDKALKVVKLGLDAEAAKRLRDR